MHRGVHSVNRGAQRGVHSAGGAGSCRGLHHVGRASGGRQSRLGATQRAEETHEVSHVDEKRRRARRRRRRLHHIEAVEGTDMMIERAGSLCPARGWTMLKTAASDHDRRADVPSIGVPTIEALARAGAGCIALGTDRVILIDKDAVLEAADRAGIAVVGVESA